jgi:GWxTD domain-containing protein
MMLCLVDSSVFAKDKESKLPPQYREWLDRDAAYLITRGEKAQFLSLTSDAERDKFIDWFWAIRNPDPDSPANAFREEHYRRLTYADDHFGIGKRVPGWATPRGRIYITLGPPKQLANYQGFDRVRPMQIWFYESTSPALPPYFYVLFYKKDSFGDYVTYSPYFNGPQDLITERGMSDSDAVQQIYRDLGQEVARTALSLLPDEPVDTNNPRPSMQSDVMMSQIHDLANSSYNVAALQRRAATMTVSSRLIVGGGTLGVLTAPLRDSDGSVKVHYLMRLRKPEDFALAKAADGGYYISLEARVQVLTSEDKPIFTQERNFKHAVSPEQLEQVKHKVLGYEDWLPLPPGHYHLKFSLGNPVNSIAYQAEANVVVPEVPTSGFTVTPMISFTSAEAVKPELSGMIPFSTAGVRFSPLLAREMNYSPATDLQFFYQIWAGPDELKKAAGNILEARYAFGRPGGVGEAKIVTDQVEAGQLDAAGTLLTGKKIPLGDWAQGNYLLTLSLDSEDKRQQASATMTFRLLLATPVDPDWDVFDGEAIANDVRTGITDYQRGLCFLAFDKKEDAERAFRAALRRSPSREEARSALVNLEAAQNNFTALSETARDFPITSSTDDETILLMAGGLDKAGSTKEAISLLQTALKLKSPNSHVYLTLASYYRQVGDARAGEDFERKGQALAAQRE